ncbi:vanin-like protein 2 [Microplitis demolitor]|uniref:vanin-like protein 2 n=1 Tax=Microplitis demolitor TaxID=69319 RepID=UPI0004CDBFD0|nr:vanin-like protein 2 [Microplitis demolitor]
MILGSTNLYLFSMFCLASLTSQVSLPSSNYYIGAVVEYHPIIEGPNSTAIAEENSENFIKFLKTANEHQVDIIVFPENGLFSGEPFPPIFHRSFYLPHSTYLPDHKEFKVLCRDVSSNVMEVVKSISCAAKQYAMYIVLNVHEKEKCLGDNCAEDGYNLYNTNIVFDRNGALIAKYRKWNLFAEVGFNKTPKPELSSFRTDFGVTFGQFICFDIFFGAPALELVREKNITDIIFSTHWFSHLPYLTANQIQAGWSYVNDVNFLGSGYNAPATGNTGTGIYAGKYGHLARIWNEKAANALIVAKIPKVLNGQRMQPINQNDTQIIYYSATEIPSVRRQILMSQQKLFSEDLSLFTSKLFRPINGALSSIVCHHDFCCNFTTDTLYHDDVNKGSNVKYYRYRYAVFNGTVSYPKLGIAGLEICSIISCLDDNPKSCNQRFDINANIVHPVTFNSIVLSSISRDSINIPHFPLSIDDQINPLNVNDFTFIRKKINETHVSLNYTLTKPYNNLMTFAIFGRNFVNDYFL